MTRIDSHQHFWHYNSSEYPWITEEKAALRRDFLPGDLRPLLAASGVDGTIAVQARQTVQETEWLLKLAEGHAFIKGVVGWVDLCAPGLRPQLEKYSKDRKFVGVRHVVHGEPDDNFMLQPAFQAGIAQLAGFGLVYDLLLYPRHLPIAAELVRKYPGQAFVLDHIANPPIRRKAFAAWERDLRALRPLPNVACKLSGMTTEAKWGEWGNEDFRVYLDVVMEVFGPNRVMVGSDWPVCTLSGKYEATLGVVSKYIERFPQVIQDGILGGNCSRVYGLAI